MRIIAGVFSFFLMAAVAQAGDEVRVLPDVLGDGPATEMMHRYLLQQAREEFAQWQADYEQRITPAAIQDYQKRMRDFFVTQLGGFPLERSRLNAHVTGTVARDGWSVEKIVFESRPRHFVTAALFLPDEHRFARPLPGVLVVCGHSRNGKANEGYQTACALLALNGIAALIVDPIGQGERFQLLDDDGNPLTGSATTEHTLIGLGSMLLGRNTAAFEIWDGMRAIDYLQSRSDIDPQRIGCMGNSGGGTQTAYLTALDDRVAAASPSCYITSFERLLATIGPQDAEQNVFGQLDYGMDHADYLMMRAPMPTLICAATHDFFDITGTWNSFRRAKRLYSRLGFAERIDLVENDDGHGYKRPLRVAAVRWMLRWLAGRDEAITEPEIAVLSESEIQCTPDGQTLQLDGAVSVADLNRLENEELARERQRMWQESPRADMLDHVRRLAGIRRLNDLPLATADEVGRISLNGSEIRKLILHPEPGIHLPALYCEPALGPVERARPVTILLDESGKAAAVRSGGAVDRLLGEGQSVLAIDVRGIGETRPTNATWYTDLFGVDGRDVMLAYLLGRSYVGMRAEDILVCARWLKQSAQGDQNPVIDLEATGELCVPALHAAAVEPDLFGSIRLERPLTSWSNLLETPVHRNQLSGIVHGALRLYDLTDLASTLGERLSIEKPVNASGKSAHSSR